MTCKRTPEELQLIIIKSSEQLRIVRALPPAAPKLQTELAVMALENVIVEAATELSRLEGDSQIQWNCAWIGLREVPIYH